MEQNTLHLNSSFVVDEVSPLLFGGFLEHMGRAVYEGVYEPESAVADKHGFRTDVLAALSDLEMTVLRYPGGNFASGYHWQDGIGPAELRPTVRELAWQSIEPNRFGTDEFVKLCGKLNIQPMLCANLGTGTPEEARNWIEYCNAPAGTRYADLRVANGGDAPHDVIYWCLGNEMDGPWQLGHVPAEQYAIRAQQAAKMMKDVDRRVRTIACGSSDPVMPGFLDWDRRVLEHLGGLADYVSLHRYVGNADNNSPDYLATGKGIDSQIEAVDACCRFVMAKRKRNKRAFLCFDEWNVWYKARGPEDTNGRGQFAPHLIEEVYNLEDALVVAQFLLSFLRHADSVKIANIAQVVNVIAPLLTRDNESLKQSIYYAFQMVSQRKGGVSLQPGVSGPRYESPSYGEVEYLDCAATLDRDRGCLNLFLVNRSLEEAMPLEVHTDLHLTEWAGDILTGPDPKLANSFEAPDVVVSEPFGQVKLSDSRLSVELPPMSFVALSVSLD